MGRILLHRLILLIAVSLSISYTLNAQVRQEIDVQEWPKGTVTLTTGEVLEGVVTYYRTQDVITVLRENGSLSSLSPVNVEKFEVSNEYSNKWHQFRTIYWDLGKDFSDFKKPTFFEELLQGNATLLMRESYYKRNVDRYLAEYKEGTVYDPSGYPIDEVFADQIKPKFFVLTPEGDVIVLEHIRKDFLDFCGKKAGMVKTFARKKKLSFELPHEFVAIVNYYNTL